MLFHLTSLPDMLQKMDFLDKYLGRFREALCYRWKAESLTVSFSFSVIFYEKRQLVKSCRIAIRIQANIMVQYERRLRMSKLI